MEKIEFSNACYQVLEILNYIKKSDIDKIPEDEIKILKDNANYENNFKYNPNKNIKEQNVSKLAKGIIAYYFEKYIATDIQKEKLKKIRKENEVKIELEKQEKYDYGNTFNNKKEIEKIDDKAESDKFIIVKKEKWYKKVIQYFKSIFNIWKK